MSLTPAQRRAVKNEEAARVLVESLNERTTEQNAEIQGLRANYADIQNKYEEMREKYHDADTSSKVLASKIDTLGIIEFIKIIISGCLLAWGFLLLGQDNKAGVWPIAAAIVIYTVALLFQKSVATPDDKERKIERNEQETIQKLIKKASQPVPKEQDK